MENTLKKLPSLWAALATLAAVFAVGFGANTLANGKIEEIVKKETEALEVATQEARRAAKEAETFSRANNVKLDTLIQLMRASR